MKLTLKQLKELIKEALDDNNMSTAALRNFTGPVDTNTPYPPKARPLPVTLTPDQQVELRGVFQKMGAATQAARKASKIFELIPGGIHVLKILTELDDAGVLLLKYLRKD